MITIRKVKVSGGKVQVDYTISNGGATLDRSDSSEDAPSPDLLEAMNGLAAHLCELCELPAEYALNMRITGLSLSYSENIMGAVIAAQKDLARCESPLNISTPHAPQHPYGGGLDYSRCLTEACAAAIERVVDEAKEYIKGKRAQLNLGL